LKKFFWWGGSNAIKKPSGAKTNEAGEGGIKHDVEEENEGSLRGSKKGERTKPKKDWGGGSTLLEPRGFFLGK